jgi:hypothetical protein
VPIERALAAGRATEAERALRASWRPVLHGPALVKWIEVAVLAHLDGVVDPCARGCTLPAPTESPVSAVAVVEATRAHRAAWCLAGALFEEFVGPSPARLDAVDRPHVACRTGAAVVTLTPDPAPAGTRRARQRPQHLTCRWRVATGHAEFVEVDLTDSSTPSPCPTSKELWRQSRPWRTRLGP